jgi:hypothetical protein
MDLIIPYPPLSYTIYKIFENKSKEVEMTKHTKTSSQEALLENLIGQNSQIQANIEKLTEEPRETTKRLKDKQRA